MAGFDVSNACLDAKFAYYLIRPSQVDPMIHLPAVLPNHPSYPSGHSCITAAYGTVLASSFPEETATLEAMVVEAGLSRNYAGLHFKFDSAVGQELGRNVATYLLSVAQHCLARTGDGQNNDMECAIPGDGYRDGTRHGIGWDLPSWQGRRMIPHGGDHVTGDTANFFHLMDDKLGIILLTRTIAQFYAPAAAVDKVNDSP